MNEKRFAAISLSNRDYESLSEKMAEAATWVEHAASCGADMAVLPETLNNYQGDGPGNTRALSFEEKVLDDWQEAAAPLFEAAQRSKIAVTIPLMVRENGRVTNSFFLVSADGTVCGRYDKMRPTLPELENGVVPGAEAVPLEWEGIRIGGAICFDTLFPEVFRCQADRGAQLFLVPSLWPGGDHLNHYALTHSVPVVLAYPAWSRIIDITGKDVAAGGYRNETLRFGFGAPVIFADINFDRVALYGNDNQEKMVDVARHYGERLSIVFDQQNVLFFLESRSPDLGIDAVLKTFDLTPRGDYLAACEEAVFRRQDSAHPESETR
jgi:predicted amidohydrolase